MCPGSRPKEVRVFPVEDYFIFTMFRRNPAVKLRESHSAETSVGTIDVPVNPDVDGDAGSTGVPVVADINSGSLQQDDVEGVYDVHRPFENQTTGGWFPLQDEELR